MTWASSVRACPDCNGEAHSPRMCPKTSTSASSPSPATGETTPYLIPKPHFAAEITVAKAEIRLGNRHFLRGAFVGMPDQWIEREPSGHYRYAHAKEWLDRLHELESALTASERRVEALEKIEREYNEMCDYLRDRINHPVADRPKT